MSQIDCELVAKIFCNINSKAMIGLLKQIMVANWLPILILTCITVLIGLGILWAWLSMEEKIQNLFKKSAFQFLGSLVLVCFSLAFLDYNFLALAIKHPFLLPVIFLATLGLNFYNSKPKIKTARKC